MIFDKKWIATWPLWKCYLAAIIKPWKYRLFYINGKVSGVVKN